MRKPQRTQGSQRLETRNQKPETDPTDRQNLLPPWHTSTAKKEPGDPDKDLGSVRNLAYLALRENDQIFK